MKRQRSLSINRDLEIEYMNSIAQGDRTVFNHVVKLYLTDMYHFAYSIMKSASKAEDVVQEACLRLWSKATKWKPTGSLKSWILRIVHNLCIDELRKQNREISLDSSILTIADTAPSQLQTHATQQSSKAVNVALFSVPIRQRMALTLVYYHGYSNIELAFIMQLSVDAVESLLARGRSKMKELLSDAKEGLLEGIRHDS